MIYFVQPIQGGRIKIGTSKVLRARLLALEREFGVKLVVLGVLDGGRREERRLHYRFGRHWIEREWFHPAPDIQEFIANNCRPWSAEEDASAPLACRPSSELRDAVAAFAQEHRWSVSQAAAVLIEQALQSLGRWPPPSSESEAD